MAIEERKIAFLTQLWDSAQEKTVGFVDEKGRRTYIPFLDNAFTVLKDPAGNPVGVNGASYTAAIDRANHVGISELNVVSKTATFTPTVLETSINGGDNLFLVEAAGSVTCTLPLNATEAFPVNTRLNVLKIGAGNVVIGGEVGVTVISADSLTATVLNTRFECWKIGPNLWHVTKYTIGAAVGTPPPATPSVVFTVAPTITPSTGAPYYPGITLTMSDGTTNVTTTKEKQWWFTDSTGYTAQIIAAGVPVTGNTYQPTDQDIDNTVYGKVVATPVFGAVVTQTVPGIAISRPANAPAPSPPPAPGATRGLTVPFASLVPSGPITVTANNQNISGRNFGTGPGVKITVPAGFTGVTIENNYGASSDSSFCVIQGGNTVFRNNVVADGWRGILINSGTNTLIQYNRFEGCSLGPAFGGHALENDYNTGPTLFDSNDVLGTYNTDAVSNFNTSRVTMTNNLWNVNITLASGAAFTMGDSLNNQPGRDNYIAFNTVIQTGIGVPPGVFGSEGNTIMEYNCFTNGIQAYNYAGNPFLGVTIRYNVIGPGYFVPEPDLFIVGWSTNIISTDCNLVPNPP